MSTDSPILPFPVLIAALEQLLLLLQQIEYTPTEFAVAGVTVDFVWVLAETTATLDRMRVAAGLEVEE